MRIRLRELIRLPLPKTEGRYVRVDPKDMKTGKPNPAYQDAKYEDVAWPLICSKKVAKALAKKLKRK